MEELLLYLAYIAVIIIMTFFLNTILDMYLGIGILYAIYLVLTRELKHFIEKRRLLKGDLVIVKYRGKYRKAYIKETSYYYDNKFQIEFDDKSLNTKLVEHNWYPISRIIIPEYMGKVAKVLFTEVEKRNEPTNN